MSHHAHEQSKYHVEVAVDRHHDLMTAAARMRWRNIELAGRGEVEIDREERFPNRVAEEQAVARALINLTKQLYEAIAQDIESVSGEHVSVR